MRKDDIKPMVPPRRICKKPEAIFTYYAKFMIYDPQVK
jgi:hypothetical protein